MGEVLRSFREVMRGNLLIFTIGDVLRQFSMFITFPYFSLYIQALGGSTFDIGIVNGLRPLISLFLYPIAGYISDRHSRVRIIAATGYVSTLIYTLFIFASDWRWLAVGTFLQGLITFYFPASNSLMADSLPSGKRGLGYSLWLGIPLAVGIFTPLAGGYLITLWGVETAMRFLYGLTFIVGIITATMNLKFLKESSKEPQGKTSKGLMNILADSYRDVFTILRWLPINLRAFGVMLILSFLFNNMVSSYWVIHVVRSIGQTEIQWGWILLTANLVNVALLIPSGMIVDKFGPKKVLTTSLLIGAIPVLLFPLSRGFFDLIILFVIMAIANSFLMSGAPAYMAKSVPPERRGRVMSTLGQGMMHINIRGSGGGGPGLGTLLTLPSILGSVLGGLLYGNSPHLLWLLFGTSMILSSFICLRYLD